MKEFTRWKDVEEGFLRLATIDDFRGKDQKRVVGKEFWVKGSNPNWFFQNSINEHMEKNAFKDLINRGYVFVINEDYEN